MSTWRLARSLIVLRKEIDDHAPNRSKVSDGTIGDPAHASRPSRHNPNNEGVVCALDITNDPAGGCDAHAIARRLVKLAIVRATNPSFEYVVSNGQIASRTRNWTWRTYTGENPHEHHVHFAVGLGPDAEPTQPYDWVSPWNAFGTVEDDDDMTDEQYKGLLNAINAMPDKLISLMKSAGYQTNVDSIAKNVSTIAKK